MGVRYNSTDSANLIQAMGNNVNIANTITDRLSDGCDYLIQSLNSGELQGAAYTAGKELFENIIIPAIKKLQEAVDDIQTELKSYKYADSVVSSYGVLDEDKLKEELKLKGEQLADVEKQIEDNNVSNIIAALVGGIAGSTSSINRLAANKIALENSKKNLEKDIKDIEERIEKLEWFVQEVANYFSDSLEVLRLATQGAESLGQITIDIYGNYSANGADLNWVEKMKKAEINTYHQHDYKDLETRLLYEASRNMMLSEEGDAYYRSQIKERLKGQPKSKWPKIIDDYNHTLKIDKDGNLIEILDQRGYADRGYTKFDYFGILKNGKYDRELTKVINTQYEELKQQNFDESSPFFIKGIVELLVSLGIYVGSTAVGFSGLTYSLATGGSSGYLGAIVAEEGYGIANVLAIDGVGALGAGILKVSIANGEISLSQASNYDSWQANKKTSITHGKQIEARVKGKKVKIRIDSEPSSGKFQVQSGSGKSSYPLNEHFRIDKITGRDSIKEWVNTNEGLKKLSKSVQEQIIDRIWKAYQRYYMY